MVVQADVLWKRLADDAHRLGQEVLDLDDLVDAPHTLGEGEDLAHEIHAALGALLERKNDPQVLGICRALPEDWRRQDDRR